MNEKRIFLIFVLFLLAAAPVFAEVCSFSDTGCEADEVGVLSTYALTNSHVSYFGHSETSYDLCCDLNDLSVSITDSCSDTYLISLSGDTSTQPINQHAGNSASAYTNDICLDSGVINDCYIANSCGADECLLSLSGVEDAHVGNCSAYDSKVCCNFDFSMPTLVILSPINGTYDTGEIFIDVIESTISDTLSISSDTIPDFDDVFNRPHPYQFNLDDGVYNITFTARNNNGNEVSELRSFIVDTVFPVFSDSLTYFVASESQVYFRAADVNLDSCWFVNETEDNELTDCNAPFLFEATEGIENTVIIWANDTAGHSSSKTLTFIPDSLGPNFVDVEESYTFTTKQLIEVQINAADDIGEVECFGINDTKFNINCSGYLTNNTKVDKGYYPLNITVNDTNNNINSRTIQINVTNSPPEISTISTIDLDEGASYALNISNYISDHDDSKSSLSIVFKNNNMIIVDFTRSTYIVNFTAPLFWSGSENILLNVSDAESFTTRTIRVDVDPIECENGTRRCNNTVCAEDCGDDEIEICNDDDTCDWNESCLCEDCWGEQSFCEDDHVCSEISNICIDDDACSSSCDNSCESAECFGLDPDCNSTGGLKDADNDGVSDCNDDCASTSEKCSVGTDGCKLYSNCESDPDNDPRHCAWEAEQAGLTNPGLCDDAETLCWAGDLYADVSGGPCCGDDLGETWGYNTDEKIDYLIVEGTCDDGEWKDRVNEGKMIYDLWTVLR